MVNLKERVKPAGRTSRGYITEESRSEIGRVIWGIA